MKTIIKASLPRAIFALEQLSAVTGNFAVKFTQISEHFRAYLRLQWADHSKLGIIEKVFFAYKTWM